MDVSEVAARRLELEGPKPINQKLRGNPPFQLAADRAAKTSGNVNRRAQNNPIARDESERENPDQSDLSNEEREEILDQNEWEDGEHHLLDVKV